MAKRKPWTEEEESLLGTDTDAAVAEILCRNKPQISARRLKLGIPAFCVEKSVQIAWTEDEISLLGTDSDEEVARQLGRTRFSVMAARQRLGIAASEVRSNFSISIPPWGACAAMPQDKFFKTIIAAMTEFTGRRVTHKALADKCYYSLSRVQKWATAGTAQEPLSLAIRHHFWLAAKDTKKHEQ